MMEPVLAEFAEHVARFPARAPQLPIVSNVTGDWLSDHDAADPKYWARQLREPVRFDDCVRRLLAGPYLLLEVGPGAALTTLARQHPGAEQRSTPSLPGPKAPGDDRIAMAAAEGRMWLAGVDVDLGDAPQRRRRVPLPTYPFQRDRHWVEADGTLTTETSPAATAPPVPRGTPHQVVHQIWADLLGIAEIDADRDFFSLGGHSLLGTKIVARIREAFDVDLPISALFETPTIAGLAATVTDLLAARRQQTPDDLADLLAEIAAMSPEQVANELSQTQLEDLS